MNRKHGRLMVFMPPGSAKSTYCSVVAPTYYMGREPDRRVILASYGSDLAGRHGRRARQVAASADFSSLFGAGLSTRTSAADEWALTNGSEYLAGGILSGITGNRAHGLVIDDPVKGRAEAQSDTISNRTWAAYNDDLLTRLIPGGWVVLVQTRWSMRDLAGRLLPEKYDGISGLVRCTDGKDWEVINLPAQCERNDDPLGRKVGEYLWPEWFDEDHWNIFKKSPRTWAALFQQRPAPSDGDLFKPDSIKIVEALPAGMRMARGWDLAATDEKENKGADWTAGAKIGRDELGRFFICDVRRFRGTPLQVEQALINTAALDGTEVPISGPQDPGQAGKSQAFSFIQKLAGYDVEFTPETGSKATRAAPFAAQVEAGNVYMLRASWNQELIDEMRIFPSGTHDDQVDALSRAFHRLLTARRWVF